MDLYLGLDCSTQTLKATVIDKNLNEYPEYECMINYDVDLPHFNTRGGVLRGKDGLTITTPTLVWVSALDLLLDKLKNKNLDFRRIATISGSGQQHGSVFWNKEASQNLKTLDPSQKLFDQFLKMFSLPKSPTWMDSSTTKYCQELEDLVGGAQKLTDLTGSIAYERFTVNQIRKISQVLPDSMNNTERISLVSSFVCSLFICDYAPIDYADASGMNSMNIHSKKWVDEIIEYAAKDLKTKLGELTPAHKIVGKIGAYFIERYKFDPNCEIVAFSGDNPCSLAGLRMKQGDVAISLGTSDTLFGPLKTPHPRLEGHIMCDPVRPDGYMAMLCYKNGSLTREHIRNTNGFKTWDAFNSALEKTPIGNNGSIGFYFKDAEITPKAAPGIHRFDSKGAKVESFSPEVEVRAVIEGQFLSLLLHSIKMGLKPEHILVTGGASQNRHILQVLSNVFGAPVFVGSQPNSACLGGAYRALHGHLSRDGIVPFETLFEKSESPFKREIEPNMDAHKVYSEMLKQYEELEKKVVEKV